MKVKIRKGLINQSTKDSIIIFDTDKSQLYTFNSTATFIFTKLKKGIDSDEICKQLADDYKITEEQAKNDVNYFIDELLRKGVAERKKNT